MNNRTKYVFNTVLFVAILITLFFLNVLKKPDNISVSERRKLAGYPVLSAERILSGKFSDEFEKYLKDQFIFRDGFRRIKAFIHFNIYRQKDNNGIYIAEGSVIKIEYPLNEQSVVNTAEKFNSLCDRYFKGMNVWYSVIPDKNYYTAEKYGYPTVDYGKMIKILKDNVQNMKYIDITGCLTLNDYYKTDMHWRQERLGKVIGKLSDEMDFSTDLSYGSYKENSMYPFYGVYYGQSALTLAPEKMIYLTNESTDKIKVHYFDTNTEGGIYLPEKFSDTDPYNLFLSGPAAVIAIENKESGTDKELILIRDSFGSSLAPLLTGEYRKITMVDLRYVSSEYLGKILTFGSQDVLIMLNTQIINNSYMLR